jgi:hypothetical protein
MTAIRPPTRRCAICGSPKDIEEHHLGGRRHAPHFTLPLCRLHHDMVTIAIREAGVDMHLQTVSQNVHGVRVRQHTSFSGLLIDKWR